MSLSMMSKSMMSRSIVLKFSQRILLFALFGVVFGACEKPVDPNTLTLWHSYRGEEAVALREVIDVFEEENPTLNVQLVGIPNEAYANKITSAVPRGNGPDAFIFAHERTGAWAGQHIIADLNDGGYLDSEFVEGLPENLVNAFRYQEGLFGLPLATKTLALYYNLDLLEEFGGEVPNNTDELIEMAVAATDRENGQYGFTYEISNFYFHSAWLFGFGGEIFDELGQPSLDSPENQASYTFASDLMSRYEVIPREPSGALNLQLFNSGNALFVLNGPWFASELSEDLNYGIAPLPIISGIGEPARPFVTVEGVFTTTQVPQEKREATNALMEFLAGPTSSIIRARVARQNVVDPAAYQEPDIAADPLLQAFAQAAINGVAMPNIPQMNTVWEPGNASLRQVIRGAKTPAEALSDADDRLTRLLAPPPNEAPVGPYLMLLGFLFLAGAFVSLRKARKENIWSRMKQGKSAYVYIAPAAFASIALIFLPFIVGSAMSLFAHRNGEFTFVGLSNFFSILSAEGYGISDPYSFYYTLAVTVLWTALNVFLHVSIGVWLALMLRDPWVKLRGIYRVLLIIPWAVPNYITALIWKGMFNVELGAINGILKAIGVTPVDWFSHFATAFSANLVTNTWLGFPFMMVVTLGALQSIPQDLEQAAEVDGATKWQRFYYITLPLLKPALLPAIILGTVWTFNMFNVIYLVSGGEPDGSTEILISEAYRWAFSRQYQYGYAAAYGVLIFTVLFLYTVLTSSKEEII